MVSGSADHMTARLVLGAAVLGAGATVLTPGLFEDFHAGRLVAVLVLAAGAIALGCLARRNRERPSE